MSDGFIDIHAFGLKKYENPTLLPTLKRDQLYFHKLLHWNTKMVPMANRRLFSKTLFLKQSHFRSTNPSSQGGKKERLIYAKTVK